MILFSWSFFVVFFFFYSSWKERRYSLSLLQNLISVLWQHFFPCSLSLFSLSAASLLLDWFLVSFHSSFLLSFFFFLFFLALECVIWISLHLLDMERWFPHSRSTLVLLSLILCTHKCTVHYHTSYICSSRSSFLYVPKYLALLAFYYIRSLVQ